MKLGERAPEFDLLGTDGKNHSLASLKGAKATIIVFSCSHCPYVIMNEDRLIAAARDYAARGVGMAAINANDAATRPEDSFAEMKKRAAEKEFPFAYLSDESQGVARAYGATNTPHLFVFDADLRLAYTGSIDDDNKFSARKRAENLYLRDALGGLVAGRPVRVAGARAVGC